MTNRSFISASRNALWAAAFAAASSYAAAQGLELFDAPQFSGARITLQSAAPDLADYGFKDRAVSVVVRSGSWELCERAQFGGTCLALPVGRYERLPPALAMRIGSVRPLAAAAMPAGQIGAMPVPDSPGDTAPLTLYRDIGFSGRSLVVNTAIASLGSLGFNDDVSSLEIRRGRWQFCVGADYGGPCTVLGPGRHALSGSFHDGISSVRPVVGPNDQPLPAEGGVLLFEDIDFNGRELLLTQATRNLGDFSFNDRASSIDVLAGRWELCTDADHGGQCLVFGPGRYRLSNALHDRVTSLRPR